MVALIRMRIIKSTTFLKPSVAQFCDACTNTTLAGACIRALPKAHNRRRTPKYLLKTPIV
jgi:hypothetical protein